MNNTLRTVHYILHTKFLIGNLGVIPNLVSLGKGRDSAL